MTEATSRSGEKLRIKLLGGFAVSIGPRAVSEAGWRLRKAKTLVKLLALAPNHSLHREQLMETLWPDLDPQAASNNLRKTLHIARRALEPSQSETPRYLYLDGDLLSLRSDEPISIDSEEFQAAAAEARRFASPSAYQAAIELYAGDLLPEDRYEEWSIGRREELRSAYVSLLTGLAQLYESGGELGQAIETLRLVAATDPLHEEAHVGLMRLYALSGQRHQALRQYDQLREALRQELDAEPTDATQRLYKEIKSGRFLLANQPPNTRHLTPDARHPLHNLPAQLTTFIGREREMAEIKRLLSGTRLLTLTGPGGSGKTRLALEVALTIVDDYPDGVWLAELAALSDPESVPPTVASSLGVREESGRSLMDTLVESLRSKKLLLALDNCEHLVGACAQLAESLLRACPRLRVFATSRESLGILGETASLVPPLSLPDPTRLPAPDADLADALMQYEAVRLFMDRASAVKPGLRLSDHNAMAIARICHRLDGIPLAIELAAARIKMLTAEQIAERLDHSFQLLASGSRTALLRHQTLNAAIEWSYNLLSQDERNLFRRLSAFAGEFRLEAVEAICSGQELEADEALDLLSHLVDKSLVVVLEDAQVGEASYRLLETVRQYAAQRLAESGEEEEQARRSHAQYYLALSEQVQPELSIAEKVDVLDRLDREHDNWRAALVWCHEHDRVAELGLAGNLWRFWYRRNYLNEGRAWLERALEGEPESPASTSLAKVLEGAGTLAWQQGDNVLARSRLDRSAAIFRDTEDKPGLARSLHFLGHAIFDQGDYAGALTNFEESLALYRDLDNPRLIYTLAGDLGLVAYHLGDYSTARTFFEDSLAHFRATHAWSGVANTLSRLGDLARLEGDYERATGIHEESLGLFRQLSEELGIASAHHKLGQVARQYGDYQRARELFGQSLALQHSLGNKQGIIECLAGLGGTFLAEGRIRHAATLFGAVEALLETIKVPLAPADRLDYERDAAAVRSKMDEATCAAAWSEGRAMSLEQAVSFAKYEV